MTAQIEIKSPQLHIRQATRDDIAFVAWCNYEASSPEPNFCYWDPLLEGMNTDAMTFIEAVFRADALAWGTVEDFLVVEEEGKFVAGASGFVMDAQDYRPLRLARLPLVANALGWSDTRQEEFRQRYEGVWSDPLDSSLAPSAAWIIECVAVVPEARGRGIARKMLQALLDKGKQQHHSHAGISVTVGNEPAQRAYEAVGFQMYLTYGAEYFDGAFPGTVKYRVRLNS